MPPILNEQNNWGTVGAIVTDEEKNTQVRDAFRGGQADKVLLPVGTVLYKFNEYPSLVSNKGAISPWWSPYQPFMHDPGWLAKIEMAKHFQISVKEWGRVTSAIKENWNSLDLLLVITLKSEVYAFFGGFASMDRIDKGTDSKRNLTVPGEDSGHGARLPGGATQFYIPNLEPGHIANWHTESLANL